MNSNYNYIPNQNQTFIMQQWEEQSQHDALNLSLSSLAQSTSLYQSCIDQEAISLNQSTETTQSHSSALIDQFENLVTVARTLDQIVTIARHENTNLITTGFTLTGGLMALLNGQIPWGLTLTGAALNQVKNIIMNHYQSVGNTNDLAHEIQTGLRMIKQLEEFQKTSLETIDQQIGFAEEQLQDAQKQLDEISSLAIEGSKDGEIKKMEAQKLCEQSVRSYQQALYNLNQSQATIQTITADFQSIIEQFENLIKQAKSNELTPTDIPTFIKQTEEILSKMKEIHALLGKNQIIFNDGLKELHQASSFNKDALVKYTETINVMRQTFDAIRLKAETEKLQDAQGKLSKAKEEVKIAQGRANNIQDLAEYERQKAEKLQGVLDDQWGTTSIMVGTTAATLAIPLGGGILSVPTGFAATAITHYIRRICKFAQTRFTNLPQIGVVEKTATTLKDLKVTYDPTSTGWGGYTVGIFSQAMGYGGRPSKTAGTITIPLTEHLSITCKFNKNSTSTQGKMDEGNMYTLQTTLREQVELGHIKPEECLSLLESLNSVETEHGTICLVASDSLFFTDLKDYCYRLIEG